MAQFLTDGGGKYPGLCHDVPTVGGMSVTVKFADRMKPPSAVSPNPTVESTDDATIEAGVEVEIDEGWLLVLDKDDSVLAAYCPGSVLSAVVVPRVVTIPMLNPDGSTTVVDAATLKPVDPAPAVTSQPAAPDPVGSDPLIAVPPAS